MPARKMRIEIFDSEGNKYSIAFEGFVTREKAIRILDLVELLGGIPMDRQNLGGTLAFNETKYDKVLTVIYRHFPMSWFSSRDIQVAYEQEFKEPVSLSTVATYLSRMVSKGMLIKAGSSKRLKYKIVASYSHATVKQQIP
ncbi:MAG: hypothetical protein QXN87_00310 [Candidatus Bathyarchaeia archaeon]